MYFGLNSSEIYVILCYFVYNFHLNNYRNEKFSIKFFGSESKSFVWLVFLCEVFQSYGLLSHRRRMLKWFSSVLCSSGTRRARDLAAVRRHDRPCRLFSRYDLSKAALIRLHVVRTECLRVFGSWVILLPCSCLCQLGQTVLGCRQRFTVVRNCSARTLLGKALHCWCRMSLPLLVRRAKARSKRIMIEIL